MEIQVHYVDHSAAKEEEESSMPSPRHLPRCRPAFTGSSLLRLHVAAHTLPSQENKYTCSINSLWCFQHDAGILERDPLNSPKSKHDENCHLCKMPFESLWEGLFSDLLVRSSSDGWL